MDSEDDICVLPHSDDDIDVDASSGPTVHFSPFLRATPSSGADDGSHFALKKAYQTLKQKLDDTKAKNQQLTRRVQELESSAKNRDLDSLVNIGESFDMMEDVRYVVESVQPAGGAASVSEEGNLANNVRRQMVQIPPPQTEGMDPRIGQYKEKGAVAEKNQALSLMNQQVAQLRQENRQLQLGWETERVDKEAALHSLQELQEKCCSLQAERDQALKEGAALHAALQKANQEVVLLKERQGENLSAEAPPELLSEMLHMRKVIDKLKTMVLMQKDCLVNRSLTASRSSLNRSPQDPPSMENLHTGSGSSHSGHSWEIVNGVVPHASDALRHQQLSQQRLGKKIAPADFSPGRGSTSGHLSGSIGRPISSSNIQNGPIANRQATTNQSRPPALNSPRQGSPSGSATQQSRTEVIYRRHSEVDVLHPKEVPREVAPKAHTLPQQNTPRLAEWMGNHYQQQQGRSAMVTQAVGLNQFMRDGTNPGAEIVVSGQVVASPSRPSQEVQYPPPPATHYPPRQASPMGQQPPSTYDNLPFPASSSSSTTSTHILNQSSMTGARVLQNNSGGFGAGGGGGAITPAPTNPAGPAGTGREGAGMGFRGPPQEHSEEPTRPRNPTDLELAPQIQFANASPAGGESGGNLDRKCPVCSQDFGHIPMDEFQTHVFECFDDAEDTSNAPETLLPQGQGSECNDRVCPMCQKSFADSISQDFFESHVQSHFEDVVNHFEVLDIHRT